MLKRLPILPTIIVALAVATMIGLGVWQMQRADWKDGLLASLDANRALPAIAYPAVPVDVERLYFRRARGFCVRPTSIRVTAGRDAAGTSGWSYLAACRTGGAEGPGMIVDIGWSPRFDAAPRWGGGPVEGLIVPDSGALIRLVSADAAPGLQPSQPPGVDTIPNNHRFYAAQWFFFASVAALIYGLALRNRWIKPQE